MKEEHVRFYSFVKTLTNGLYRFWYSPKIIGKENIPDEEGIVFCGNHIHVMDQFSVMSVSKRMIHFMAKKEYFNGPFAWFFKSGGCISVDRSKKDEEAKEKAIEILNKKEALGLFPEGTRNIVACKEEKLKKLYEYYENKYSYKRFKKILKVNNVRISQINYLLELVENKTISLNDYISNILDTDKYLKNLLEQRLITSDKYYDTLLLPFKFGAVSFAEKTDSYIILFVTKGHYKFRSKDLTIIIGKPFKVNDMSLEEANSYLRQEMINMFK